MAKLFWSNASCKVWLDYRTDGGLEFSGVDLAAFGTPGYTYEYFVKVPTDQFGTLRTALGVAADADVLDAVCARPEPTDAREGRCRPDKRETRFSMAGCRIRV